MIVRESMTSMVVWPQGEAATYPHPSGVWVDTGEGGLFAYAVIEAPGAGLAPPRDEGGCFVNSFVTLSFNDPIVGGAQLADPGDGGPALESSAPLAAAVFLGATDRALSKGGYHFAVTKNHLSDAGLALVAALEAAYGAPMSIVTMLDA